MHLAAFASGSTPPPSQLPFSAISPPPLTCLHSSPYARIRPPPPCSSSPNVQNARQNANQHARMPIAPQPLPDPQPQCKLGPFHKTPSSPNFAWWLVCVLLMLMWEGRRREREAGQSCFLPRSRCQRAQGTCWQPHWTHHTLLTAC